METGLFGTKREWAASPMPFGNSGDFLRADGFYNASAKKEATLTTGCKKPLVLTSWGRQSIEYRDCMKAYNANQTASAQANQAAKEAELKSAPDLAAAEKARAEAEQAKTARALSPMAIFGIVAGSAAVLGTVVFTIIKMSK